MKKLKIVFMGTPSFAVPILEGLINNYNVSMVVCQPDRKKNRKGEVIKPDTKVLAEQHNIKVFQPLNLKEDYQEILNENPDLIITCAYGQILPTKILNYPKYGCINIHASLLPKYRGAAPIQWSLINGDKETGITLMYMDEFMDTGDMIDKIKYTIKDTDDIGTLHDELSLLGGEPFEYSNQQGLAPLVKKVKAEYPDKKIVGWQHTHPGYGIFLSSYDIFIQENFYGKSI